MESVANISSGRARDSDSQIASGTNTLQMPLQAVGTHPAFTNDPEVPSIRSASPQCAL